MVKRAAREIVDQLLESVSRDVGKPWQEIVARGIRKLLRQSRRSAKSRRGVVHHNSYSLDH